MRRLKSIDNTSSDEEEHEGGGKSSEVNKILGDEEEDRKDDSVHEFQLEDVFEFARKGIRAIADDNVTKRFSTEELQTWNLLTRTNKNYHIVSYRLMLLWSLGWIIRFCLLLPMRILIFIIGTLYLMITTSLLGFFPEGAVKRWLYRRSSITSFRILSRSVLGIIRFHDRIYRPRNASLCVANHTSPFDAVILHTDNAYALVGQLHGGYLGIMSGSLSRATSHCFFNRFEMSDRAKVVQKMREHVTNADKLPILIFPEGTCINNSAVMMFKKGSFEVADIVHPVAFKYDSIFGDAFWDSSKYGYFTYIMRMMTSWAIVADVWYMKPMVREVLYLAPVGHLLFLPYCFLFLRTTNLLLILPIESRGLLHLKEAL